MQSPFFSWSFQHESKAFNLFTLSMVIDLGLTASTIIQGRWYSSMTVIFNTNPCMHGMREPCNQPYSYTASYWPINIKF